MSTKGPTMEMKSVDEGNPDSMFNDSHIGLTKTALEKEKGHNIRWFNREDAVRTELRLQLSESE